MLAKIICALPKWMGGGHKRGVRISTPRPDQLVLFRCPRCESEWLRKERPAPKLKAVA